MPDSQEQSWSDDPNAPKITHYLYFREKAGFAGYLIGSILYGVLTVLFFRCIAALFTPIHRQGEPIKWGLVSYTVVMFSVATVQTAMYLNRLSISYIDNREFSGIGNGWFSPGPAGYQFFISSEALAIVPNVMFALNNWLADGFLLYRCYLVYSMNSWVIAFPCLMYIGSFAMGIALEYQSTKGGLTNAPLWAGFPYYSISLSLNILLTLMIVVRLILRARTTRTALGIAGIGGLSKAIVTMLIESCVLYAVSSLLVIGPWGAGNPITSVFLPILDQTQVIAPLLIIQRVANKSALTKKTLASGRLSLFKARNRGVLTGGSGTLPDGDSVSSVDRRRVVPGEFRTGVQTSVRVRSECQSPNIPAITVPH